MNTVPAVDFSQVRLKAASSNPNGDFELALCCVSLHPSSVTGIFQSSGEMLKKTHL